MFSLEYGGRATEYAPELLKTTGKPGRCAAIARDAVWEAVQQIAEGDPRAWVRINVTGWEESGDKVGLGRFLVGVDIIDSEPSELDQFSEAAQN